jgi:hypothetical protein
MRASAALASLALAAALTPLGAQPTQTLDTRAGQAPVGVWIYLSPTDAQLAGQTFIAPAGATVMQSASVWAVNLAPSQPALRFEAILQGFDTQSFALTGPVLYTSAVQTVSGGYLGASDPMRFDFDLGGVQLDEGMSYAFLARRVDGAGGFGYHPASAPYADGLPIWKYSLASGAAVFRDFHDYETGFVATFTAPEETAPGMSPDMTPGMSPERVAEEEGGLVLTDTAPLASTVPEPSTWALLGSGMLMLGGVAARRRRGATA